LLSCDPAGLPIVDGFEEGGGGEGSRDALGDRGGGSIGGSSTAVVVCEGVWLLEETWAIGDTGGVEEETCAAGEADC
jgi:hypothetical protein